ncbi:MAG: hypothetical protein AB1Z98_18230 [Nannocystaceae bacterium]
MKPRDTCPTCGTALGPLHDKDALQRCSSCDRLNPRGFYYCGYCAAPMETTAHRAELAEVAAPPGGWPSLKRELVEVQFFLDRGELDEAFERLGILRERYPGHPELVELQRGRDRGPRPDTQVNRVVDSVLSSSASLSDAMPRRAPPQWKAPTAGDDERPEDGRTRAHEVVPGAGRRDASVRKKIVRAAPQQRAGSFPTVSEGDARPKHTDVQAIVPHVTPPARPRVKTNPHLGAAPIPKPGSPPVRPLAAKVSSEPEPEPPTSTKPASSAAPAPFPGNPGHTVVVPTLQPAAPFAEPGDETAGSSPPVERPRGGVRKRALKSRKRSGAQRAVEGDAASPRPRRARGNRFGQHVLGRLGGKGNGSKG